jgi:hypothetical protein
VSVKWEGLAELKKELRELPRELAGKAQGIVFEAAVDAMQDATPRYPIGPTQLQGRRPGGNLRRGLRVFASPQVARSAASVKLLSAAPHAHLYEYGTVQRKSRRGNRGTMTGTKVFWPAVGRAKKRMWRQLIALLRAHGLAVKGTA